MGQAVFTSRSVDGTGRRTADGVVPEVVLAANCFGQARDPLVGEAADRQVAYIPAGASENSKGTGVVDLGGVLVGADDKACHREARACQHGCCNTVVGVGRIALIFCTEMLVG